MTKTERLFNQINSIRGLSYPNKGYMFYADVTGDGSNRKGCYTISNDDGGVTPNKYSGVSSRVRCARLRHDIHLLGHKPVC